MANPPANPFQVLSSRGIPTSSTSALADVYSKWQVRIGQAKSQGFATAPLEDLYKADWAKVAAGGSAMSASEAQAAIDSAFGYPPVVKQPRTGLLGTLENVPGDIGNILWNFPKGVVETVHHLPSSVSHLAQMAEGKWLPQGWETPHGGVLSEAAQFARDLNRAPLGALIPGVSDVAALTTSESRKSLQQHPVGAALDVAPVAGEAAKLGVLGEGISSSVAVGEAANEADNMARAGRLDLADSLAQKHGFSDYLDMTSNIPRSARTASALAAGRPLKALIRGVPQLDEARLSLLDKFNATPLAAGFNRAKIMAGNEATILLGRYTKDVLKPVVETHATDEDILRLNDLAAHPDQWPTASTQDQASLSLLQSAQQARTADDIANGHLLPFNVEGQQVVYAGTQRDMLATLQGRLDSAIAKADAADARVQRLQGEGRPDEDPELRKAIAKQNDAHTTLNRRDRLINRTLARTVPAAFQPQVEDMIRQKVMAYIGQSLGQDTKEFSDALSAYDRGKPLGSYIPADVLAKYTNEARASWQQLVSRGLPIWVPNMDDATLERALHPIRLSGKKATPGIWQSKYVNQTVGSSNIVLALGQAERDALHYQATERLLDSQITPLMRTTSEIDAQLEGEYQKLRGSTSRLTPDAQLQNRVRNMAWRRVDSSLNLGSTPKLEKLYSEDHWIPKDLADAIQRSFQPARVDNELSRLNMGINRLFKTTVMGLSPEHQAHIWLGSILPLVANGGWEELNPTRWIDGFHISKALTFDKMDQLNGLSDGSKRAILTMNRTLDTVSADELMQYSYGAKLGALASAAHKAGDVLSFSRKLSELGANMYRSISYLSEEARQLRDQSIPDELAYARAATHANQTFVDIGSMTPIEQSIAKSIFPFYSYTKYALRFIMQYPVDHPLRASILANLGEQEAAYNSSHGIPNTMAMLFSMGSPDATGSQWGAQLRAFNPFRNIGTTFTMAGIIGGLNPVLRGLFTQAGVNTLSGAPNPYPGLDIDPNTGGLVGKAQGQSPLAAAEQVIPQLSLLDHYFNLSQQARTLKAQDPQAYRRQVFTILGLPFVPQSYTPVLSGATRARDQVLVAQSAVSAALKNQDLSGLSVYEYIPVPAKLKPYLGNQTFAPTDQFDRVVNEIWQQERQTGIAII